MKGKVVHSRHIPLCHGQTQHSSFYARLPLPVLKPIMIANAVERRPVTMEGATESERAEP